MNLLNLHPDAGLFNKLKDRISEKHSQDKSENPKHSETHKSNGSNKIVPLDEQAKNASSSMKAKEGQLTDRQKRMSLSKIQQFEGFNRLKN